MKAHTASKTAEYMAFFRALETARPKDRSVFRDPYARLFLSPTLKLLVTLSSVPIGKSLIPRLVQREAPGAFSSGVARTRLIDDLLEGTVRAGAKQVILLGAGFDTRALRLDFLKDTAVIEIDHPDTSRVKQDILKSTMARLPGNVSYCQADFNRQSLDDIGAASNIDFGTAATIIWEGVTNYLSADAVDATFKWTGKFSRVDVIFTYIDKKVLHHPEVFAGTSNVQRYLRDAEEQWTFGFSPPELPGYLAAHGLSLIENVTAREYCAKYLGGRGTVRGYEFYRVALARSRGAKGKAEA
jgi:methyltransferase (TIGR00027 family)